MNYTKKLSELLTEARKLVQYKRLPKFIQVGMFICLIPMIIYDIALIVNYYIAAFILKGFSTPIEVLHSFVKNERAELRHASEAVLYAITIPFIFFCNIILALFSLHFYIAWFLIMLTTYIITLGGIRWQPFITEAEFDSNANYVSKTSLKRAKKLTLVPVICLILVIVIAIVSFALSFTSYLAGTMFYNSDVSFVLISFITLISSVLSVFSGIIAFIQNIFTIIIIPITFKISPAEDTADESNKVSNAQIPDEVRESKSAF